MNNSKNARVFLHASTLYNLVKTEKVYISKIEVIRLTSHVKNLYEVRFHAIHTDIAGNPKPYIYWCWDGPQGLIWLEVLRAAVVT